MSSESQSDKSTTKVDEKSATPNSENQSDNPPTKVDEKSTTPVMVNTSIVDNTEWSTNYQKRYSELEELLEFAAETGKLDQPDLVMKVKQLKKVLFYTSSENLSFDELCESEAQLEELYATMTNLVHPVDISTLRATSIKCRVQRPWWSALFLGSGSVGRNFFRQLFWVVVLICGSILLVNFLVESKKTFIDIVNPFLFGALGAWVYLYKDLTKHYVERTLHPEKLATNWLRLMMGGLAGGLLVYLFKSAYDESQLAAMGSVGIGFLAGYSVDFFYQSLDKIISVVTPQGKTDQAAATLTPRQAQIESLAKLLKETNNEEDKAVIRGLLEKQ
ncbi:hypothetical protein [Candidatus Parabeggiatoa sp. HSG14]|uniref:hypothetical protein n=1 Tax=Candidatus Parabeggiatoa sp. HSG14 TaxID=3055593 RepID=UPI0025A6AD66|nr:hypothetical protein [Thiotrichales bacterium HSG14]